MVVGSNPAAPTNFLARKGRAGARPGVRKAEVRHERQSASLECRRRYKAAWMRAHRAKGAVDRDEAGTAATDRPVAR